MKNTWEIYQYHITIRYCFQYTSFNIPSNFIGAPHTTSPAMPLTTQETVISHDVSQNSAVSG
jgi:hypothetical protein